MWSRFQRQNGSVGHVCGSVCIIYNQMHIPTLVNTQKSIYTYPCRAILTFIFVKKMKKNGLKLLISYLLIGSFYYLKKNQIRLSENMPLTANWLNKSKFSKSELY